MANKGTDDGLDKNELINLLIHAKPDLDKLNPFNMEEQ